MSAPAVAAWLMLRRIREHKDAENNRRPMTTNTQAKPQPQTQPEKSAFAAWSFRLMFLSIFILIPALFALAINFPFTFTTCILISGISGLAAINLAILSLREGR
jgi:hypothetical protein